MRSDGNSRTAVITRRSANWPAQMYEILPVQKHVVRHTVDGR